MAATIEELEGRIEKVRQQLRADHDRAVVSRQSEVDAVDYDIKILAAEKTRLTEIGQIRAPFAGKVVYRNPARGWHQGIPRSSRLLQEPASRQQSDCHGANSTSSRRKPILSNWPSTALCSINFLRDG